MKSKKSANQSRLRINKQTIAHLDHRQMVKVGGGDELQGELQPRETDPDICQVAITPVPIDFGITPHHP